ncbi:hypothetical protein KPG66_04720 [Mycetohabitans sp. B2]|uniref:hypothetical protein n=1 Tax=Mycetohabitans sp. B2 TaxID=2841274 RepID=UPI001F2FDAD2|nr:hypothetical protein [Mycetohabitans sp. B2]MCF7695441.1 hypothetical protein [Mycetohabitans sp. B2]
MMTHTIDAVPYSLRGQAALLVSWRALVVRPLEQWPAMPFRIAIGALAALSFSGTLYVSQSLRDERMRAEAVAVAELRAKTAQTHRQISALPALRSQLEQARAGRIDPDVAQHMQRIDTLAARAGLLLDSVEPVAEFAVGEHRGEGAQAVARQTARLAASGDFIGAWSFLGSLSTLPVIAVPDEVQLKVDGGQLSLRALLTLYGMRGGPGLAAAGCGCEGGHESRVPLPARSLAADAVRALDASKDVAAERDVDADQRRAGNLPSPLPPDPFSGSRAFQPRMASVTSPVWIGTIWSGSHRIAVVDAIKPRLPAAPGDGTDSAGTIADDAAWEAGRSDHGPLALSAEGYG